MSGEIPGGLIFSPYEARNTEVFGNRFWFPEERFICKICATQRLAMQILDPKCNHALIGDSVGINSVNAPNRQAREVKNAPHHSRLTKPNE